MTQQANLNNYRQRTQAMTTTLNMPKLRIIDNTPRKTMETKELSNYKQMLKWGIAEKFAKAIAFDADLDVQDAILKVILVEAYKPLSMLAEPSLFFDDAYVAFTPQTRVIETPAGLKNAKINCAVDLYNPIANIINQSHLKIFISIYADIDLEAQMVAVNSIKIEQCNFVMLDDRGNKDYRDLKELFFECESTINFDITYKYLEELVKHHVAANIDALDIFEES